MSKISYKVEPHEDDRAIAPMPLWKRLSRTTATYIFLVNLALLVLFGLKSTEHSYLTMQYFAEPAQ